MLERHAGPVLLLRCLPLSTNAWRSACNCTSLAEGESKEASAWAARATPPARPRQPRLPFQDLLLAERAAGRDRCIKPRESEGLGWLPWGRQGQRQRASISPGPRAQFQRNTGVDGGCVDMRGQDAKPGRSQRRPPGGDIQAICIALVRAAVAKAAIASEWAQKERARPRSDMYRSSPSADRSPLVV